MKMLESKEERQGHLWQPVAFFTEEISKESRKQSHFENEPLVPSPGTKLVIVLTESKAHAIFMHPGFDDIVKAKLKV